jgi:hypothetical protein
VIGDNEQQLSAGGATATYDIERKPASSHLGLQLLLIALAAAALWFIVRKVALYTRYDPQTYDVLWPRRGGLIAHLAGGMVAILTGLVQLWLGLTGRTSRLHRMLGRVYVGSVLVAAPAGAYLALTATGGFAYGAGLFGLAFAWLLTTGMAVIAIHRRVIRQHREWMIRSMIVTFAFVTFRAAEPALLAANLGPADQIDTFLAFASWCLPLLIAEPLLQWSKLRRGA